MTRAEHEFWLHVFKDVRRTLEKNMRLPAAGRPDRIYSWDVSKSMGDVITSPIHGTLWMNLHRGLGATINGHI